MFKLLLLLILSSFTAVSADNFMEFRSDQNENFKVKRSKWLVDIGAKYIGYQVDAPAFDAQHADVDAEDTLTTYSFGLGLGREFYLGKSFSVSIKASAFIAGNSKEQVGNAAEDLEYVLSTYKESYDILGQEFSASLNYIFEGKIVHIQPFFEFGAGRGTTTLSREYSDNGIDSDPDQDGDYLPQEYSYAADEDFLFTRITLGVNFLSNYNINSFIKISQNSFNIKERRNIKSEASINSTPVALTLPGNSGNYTATSASVGMNVTF